MKNQFKSNFDIFIIIFLSSFIFLLIFLPFWIHNSLDNFDTPGILSIAWFIENFTFPDFQGFNPIFYAGYPQGTLYPFGFHYLLALIAKISSLEIGYKFLITFSGLILPFSIHYFSKSVFNRKGFALLNSLIILFILIISPAYLGFNYRGAIEYGLAPSFFSGFLFFLYIGRIIKNRKSWLIPSILMSLLILIHLVSALIAVSFTLLIFVFNFKNQRGQIFKIGLTAFSLTAFWIVPFLYFISYGTSGFSSRISLIYPLTSVIISILFIMFFLKNERKDILRNNKFYIFIIVLLISLLSIFDNLINKSETKISFLLLHPFRIQIYSLIFTGILITSLIQYLHQYFLKFAKIFKVIKFFEINKHLAINFISIIAITVVSINFFVKPKGPEEIQVPLNLTWDGRAMRIYKVSEVSSQSRAIIDKSVMLSNGNFATMGLLKESSFLAPYFQNLAKNINPDNYNWEDLDSRYIENKRISETKADFLMNLMWVKNVFTIDNTYNKCSDFTYLDKFVTDSSSGVLERELYLCKYSNSSNSNFIQVIDSSPQVINTDWDKKLSEWWLSDEQTLFANTSITNIPNRENSENINNNLSYEWSSDYQTLTVINSSGLTVPILIKLNYFPNWRAYDKDNNELEVTRISPSFMSVNADELVTFKYTRSSIELIAIYFSLLSSIIIFIFVLKQNFRKVLFNYLKKSIRLKIKNKLKV